MSDDSNTNTDNDVDNNADNNQVRSRDSIRNVIAVALSVCFVCAVVVSTAAVSLKSAREANKELDRNRNVLEAAGLYRKGETRDSEVAELFRRFEVRLVSLETNDYLSDAEAARRGLDPQTYDQRKAARDPALSDPLDNQEDVAGINRQARYVPVYLLKDGDGIDKIVLPVHGYGLWSTMYGFIALEGDLKTVAGITFYEQGETAGLGGEVDNPDWKARWQGKVMYENGDQPLLRVRRGAVMADSAGAEYLVDGLSGATLTTRGVDNLVQFWMGDAGFGPFLSKLRNG